MQIFRSELQLEKQLASPIWWQEKRFLLSYEDVFDYEVAPRAIHLHRQEFSKYFDRNYGWICRWPRLFGDKKCVFFAQRRGRLRSRSRTSCHTSSSAEVCPSRFFIVGSLTIVWWWVTFFCTWNLLTLELLLNAYRACCLGLVFIHKHKMLFLNNSSVAWSASFLSRQLFLQECSNYDNNFYRNQSHFTMRLAKLFFTRETSMTYPLLKMFESSQCSSE